ncbi:MAG: lytic murein transglycosylase [bacterium]
MAFLFQRILLVLCLLLALVSPDINISAQTPAEERQALEDELKKLETEIAQYEKDIAKTQSEKNTLKSQISVLKSKIAKLDLQIRQSNAMIGDLTLQIADTQKSINQTSDKIKESQSGLAAILQTIYQSDRKSLVEILLSEREVSDFFDDLANLEALSSKAHDFLKTIKSLKVSLEDQKQALDDEKIDLKNLVEIQILQKQESQSTEKEKNSFLALTEAQYQKMLKDKEGMQQRASEIKARIFELIGVPEAPTFGEAYALAKEVEKITGVRSVLILAVLTQESNIGKNVGQCYLKNPNTGSGVIAFNGKEVKNVMKPTRDVQPFLEITKGLGRDPYNTPVSCPIPAVGGYGGAMGPAQFIPSTWMLYRDRLEASINRPADPWNIKDAFLASALYLADAGAKNQTYNSEWRAAMIYFSGGTNVKYRFYGDSVMSIVTQYEKDIKEIEGI